MKNAALTLVKYALAQGHTVSVYDGEEWQVKRSSNYRAIVDAIESVEEAQIRVRNEKGVIMTSALLSLFGLEPDETIIDCSDNEYMAQFDEHLAKA